MTQAVRKLAISFLREVVDLKDDGYREIASGASIGSVNRYAIMEHPNGNHIDVYMDAVDMQVTIFKNGLCVKTIDIDA